MERTYNVSITQLKISRPFLKVFARNLKGKHSESLNNLQHLFEEESDCSEVQLGAIYIARVNPSQYERCRVVQVIRSTQSVSVFFVDCGCMGTIKFDQVRSGFYRSSFAITTFTFSTAKTAPRSIHSRPEASKSRIHSGQNYAH